MAEMEVCMQGVHELNRTTAVYVSVARDLGSMIDSLVLRRQLTCIRKRALLIAHQNKRNILPHLRRASREKAERDDTVVDVSQMENLWDAHSMCLTLLQCQLMRTLRLVRHFPIANCCEAHSAGTFIETGLTATKYVPQLFVTFDILPDNVDYKEIENATTECSECYLALLQDIEETTKLVDESQKVFEVNPWDFEPDFFPVAGTSSCNRSSATVSPASNFVSVSHEARRRRRKIYLISATTAAATVIIVSAIVGVLLTS